MISEQAIGRKSIPILWLLRGLCVHLIILILLFDEIVTLAGKGNGTDVTYLGFAGIRVWAARWPDFKSYQEKTH